MKNKLLSIILAVAILASLCSMMIVPVSAATASSLSTDSEGAYLIQSAADIEIFRQMLCSGETFATKTVKLTADITLENDYVYTMDGVQGHGFEGVFDGQGHTIYNLVVANSKNNGFFGFFDGDSTNWGYNNDSSTIKNVAFVNSKSISNTGKTNVGLFYGAVYGATVNVENVYVDTVMYSPGTSGNMVSSHGGLVGYTYGMHLNIKNSVLNVKTETAGCTLRGCGAIAGVLDGATANKLTFEQSALFGDVHFTLTYVAIGAKSGVGAPEVSLTNAIADLKHTTKGDGWNYPCAVGLWKNSAAIYETANVEVIDVSGLDADTVEGFTKTVGHLVPTSLLKMFPEHCLEEADVTGGILEFEGYQTNNDNKMRLVATIADKDIKNYNSVGFEVVAVYGENVKSTSFTSKTVYTSIGANTATGDTTISAESLIGADGYIFAMIIGNLPADTHVTLQVKTFYTDINDTQTDGSTTVFTVSQMPSGTVSGGK